MPDQFDVVDRNYFSPQEFSVKSGLSMATVYRYMKARILPFHQPAGARGRRLIPADAFNCDPTNSANPISTAASKLKLVSQPIPGPKPKWTKRLKKDKETDRA